MIDQMPQAKTPAIAWKPLEGSQALVMGCPCEEILYHGTRGPGKTAAQIAYFVGRCGIGYRAKWRGVIFDREYKNLDDIVAKSLEMIPLIFPGARFLASKSDLKWVFPDGEELLFRHIKKPKDYHNYHGHEYPFIGWNELTKYPTSELYNSMKSCNRSSFVPALHSPQLTDADRRIMAECLALDEPIPSDVSQRLLPDIPLVTFSTTNPHGPGHNWVKRKFIDKAPPGVPIRTQSFVFNPRTQQEEIVTTTQVHIFGSYKENKFLDVKYVAGLNAIKDPNKRRAWLGGDWSITSGGALDDLWKPGTHILPRFIVPKAWRLTRSFDWGSTHPFSVGFWAIANGEEITLPNGKKFCPFKGSLIRFGEIYGCEHVKDDMGKLRPEYGTNKGIRASAREVARRIKEFEEELKDDGWIESKVTDGPADGQIFNVNESESLSIGRLMESEGVTWYAADKSAGTRKNGLELVRIALENANQGEGPGVYVMGNCEAFIETVPGLPRDEDDLDDIDTTAEDHCFVAGTKIETENGPMNIEDINPGVRVWTRGGLKPVFANHITPGQRVFGVSTTKGALVGTGNHPIFANGEWKRIDLLTKGDILETWSAIKQCQKRSAERRQRRLGQTGERNHPQRKFANGVGVNMKPIVQRFLNSVAKTAKRKHCVIDVQPAGVDVVYNLTIEGCHEYFANGVLVHNCYDETRYMLLDNKPVFAGSVSVGMAI